MERGSQYQRHLGRRRAINLTLNPGDTATLVQIGPARTLHIDVLDLNVTAHTRAAAHQVSHEGIVLLAGGAVEVADVDVGDGEIGRILVAQREVLLAVALGDFDGIVDIGDSHGVVGDVGDGAEPAAALQVAREGGGQARPHFYAGPVGRVAHGDVVNLAAY